MRTARPSRNVNQIADAAIQSVAQHDATQFILTAATRCDLITATSWQRGRNRYYSLLAFGDIPLALPCRFRALSSKVSKLCITTGHFRHMEYLKLCTITLNIFKAIAEHIHSDIQCVSIVILAYRDTIIGQPQKCKGKRVVPQILTAAVTSGYHDQCQSKD